MKKLILAAISIVVISGAHGYGKAKDDVNADNGKSQEIISKSNGNTVKPVEVKNIWKDMPGYDKYGNEITPRMRYNMQQNAILSSKNKSQENKENVNNTTGENK